MDHFSLGILLVHGIGSQAWGDSLVRSGDVLVRTITESTGGAVAASVEEAGPHLRGDDKIAEAHVRLEYEGQDEYWLLAEGWWADAFPPPTYGELVSWSLRALPWAIALNVARRYWNADANQDSRVMALAIATGKLLVLLPIAPFLVLLLACLLLLGLIPPLRGWVLGVQSVLTATMGDSLAFVESPIRAALIRTRLIKRLAELDARCDRVVVVAHSQGAAAMLDALGGISESGRSHSDDAPLPETLVTYGAGINQLVSQRVISSGALDQLKTNPLVVATGTTLMLYVVTAIIAWQLWADPGSSVPYAIAAAAVVLTAATAIGLSLASSWVLQIAAKQWTSLEAYRRNAMVAVVFTAIIASVGLLLRLDQQFPVGVVALALWAVVLLVGGFAMILSQDLRVLVQAPVKAPRGLRNWIDLYSSADPVPNGRTLTDDSLKRGRASKMPASVALWNRGSMLSDHTTYWENVDGFVLRVVNICATTARSTWKRALRHNQQKIDDRSRWRVAILRGVRSVSIAMWGWITLILYARGLVGQVPMPPGVPAWFPTPIVRPGLFIVLIAIGAVMTSAAIFAIWRGWTRTEQRAVVGGMRPGSALNPITSIVAIVWTLLVASLLLLRPLEGVKLDAGLLWLLAAFGFFIFGLAILSAYVLLKIVPAPEVDAHRPAARVPESQQVEA